MVVTGDVTQVDLPFGQMSGLIEAADLLEKIDGISVCRLTSADVVRHPLVQSVVDAYAELDKKKTIGCSAFTLVNSYFFCAKISINNYLVRYASKQQFPTSYS